MLWPVEPLISTWLHAWVLHWCKCFSCMGFALGSLHYYLVWVDHVATTLAEAVSPSTSTSRTTFTPSCTPTSSNCDVISISSGALALTSPYECISCHLPEGPCEWSLFFVLKPTPKPWCMLVWGHLILQANIQNTEPLPFWFSNFQRNRYGAPHIHQSHLWCSMTFLAELMG